MGQDFSKSVILVLLALTIVASLLSTFTVLSTLKSMDTQGQAPVSDGGSSSASVALSIMDPNERMPNVQGQVTLDIRNPEVEKNE